MPWTGFYLLINVSIHILDLCAATKYKAVRLRLQKQGFGATVDAAINKIQQAPVSLNMLNIRNHTMKNYTFKAFTFALLLAMVSVTMSCSVFGGGSYSNDPAVSAQEQQVSLLKQEVREAERLAEEAKQREKAAKNRLKAAEHELKALEEQAKRRSEY